MGMTDREQKDLRNYCAFLLKEYGFHFSPDNPVIPALYIIYKEMQVNGQSNKELALQVKKAAEQIKPQVFQFNNENEAWQFQWGITFRWIVIGVLIIILGGLGTWVGSKTNFSNTAHNPLQASKTFGELMKRVKQDAAGTYFIDFTAATGDSIQHFQEYQKLNVKTVRVYLGKESN
jgi:hypothetical protein